MEFDKIRSVIRLAEHAVVQNTPFAKRDDLLRELSDELLVGPWLILSGLGILWKRFVWVLGLTIIIAVYLRLFDHAFSASAAFGALMLATLCVYFGLPSRTVLAGVNGRAIGALAVAIGEQVRSKDELERLSSGVQLVKVQTTERLARFNVFTGIVWGALFWFAGARVFSPTVPPEVVESSIFPIIAASVLFSVLFTAAVGYATAVRVVYQTLDFALIEVGCALASAKTPSEGSLIAQLHNGRGGE
ncbi:hypothetical protein VDR86_20155 [Xanthomonas campestris pv. campestris]|uniref:hypothetical protein n=1 Tax=Xanthomonas campestris TaxID=339 RepID=UPI0025A30223|nr:hypothetical protein [Xanthomonas campestris]MDM7706246.1 hypothetical protein [Xanthomonas campestris pv. campestris]MDM7880951.1 hypothetical protein [Xanthomonas campestris pv. campestris]MDO0860864.1 hypothetical protein [Xanthomonas campestris pv. campestris]MEB1935935.1 hypothetical protein [Xanthomonas campestris pv. campestris]MEB1948466.1 hypothetical protein [Xanthomonas campestris pv. campestris]